MKKLLVLLLSVGIAASSSALELSNPGFENGEVWWNSQVNENATAVFDFESTEARTGSYACHAEVTAVTSNNWEVQLNMPNNWTATSGNVYTVEFYAKADVAASIHVAAQDGAPNYTYRTGADFALSAGADWKKITFEYTADQDGEAAVNFNIFVGGGIANYYFDDFTLTETVVTPLPDFMAPPTKGAFETDTFRNLFAEANKAQSIIDSKVNTAFDQLFYGDNDNERVYYQIADSLAYILAHNSEDIRSEGMSYGMMIAVQLNKKFEFDCLWNYTKTYMYHNEGPRKGYFSWSIDPKTHEMLDENSASDGEEYFAMALFFAAHRWGNGNGIYDYEAEAQQLLYDMLHLEERNDGIVNGLTNMFDAEEKQVVFVPQNSNADFTDPSYHLPAFYKLWAEWADQDNDFWKAAADTSREFLKRATHPETGLVTDYMNFDGTPHLADFHANSINFSSDSYRVAMNIAMDCSWWGYEEWHSETLDTLLLFFHRQGASYQSQYEQDGTLLEDNWSASGLYAMNGVAPLGATVQESWDFINKLWGMPVPSGEYRYYDGLLYMLGILNAAGEYKIWQPGDTEITPEPEMPEVVIYDPYATEPADNDTTPATATETFSTEATISATINKCTNTLQLINPAKAELTSIALYALSGAEVAVFAPANSQSFELPELTESLYIARIQTADKTIAVKLQY